jgi:hypothetical protein
VFRPYPRFPRSYRPTRSYRPNRGSIGILACVLMVIGGPLNIVSTIILDNAGKPINGGIITTGTVSSVSVVPSCDGSGYCTHYYDFAVSFTTTKGQVVTINESTDNPITTGTTQKISYLPSDPESARDLSIREPSLLSSLLIGVIVFFLGVLGLIYYLTKRKREMSLQIGNPLPGK